MSIFSKILNLFEEGAIGGNVNRGALPAPYPQQPIEDAIVLPDETTKPAGETRTRPPIIFENGAARQAR